MGVAVFTACVVIHRSSRSTEDSATPVTIAAGAVGEITYDCDNVQQLFDLLNGTTATTYQQITTLSSTPHNAVDFVDPSTPGWLQVTFGGKRWYAAYLSQTNEHNPRAILTLWLADSVAPSVWNWNNATADDDGILYPSDLYGSSYVRTVELNNPGKYSPDGKTLTTVTVDADHPLARFTDTTRADALTNLIVQPELVEWQRAGQSAVPTCGYNLKNENWGEEPATGWFNADSNYYGKDFYDAWWHDYLWLPSITELYQYWGMEKWNPEDEDQDVNQSVRPGEITYDGRPPYALNYWTRSGAYDQPGYVGGAATPNFNEVDRGHELRPALHLDLSQLAPQHDYQRVFDAVTGTTTATCRHCGDSYTYECQDENNGHVFITQSTATCETAGYIYHYCRNCNYCSHREATPALGHNFSPWTTVVDGAVGEQYRVCATCSKYETRVVKTCVHQLTLTNVYDHLTLQFTITPDKVTDTNPYTVTDFMRWFNGLSDTTTLRYTGTVRYYDWRSNTWVATKVTAWEKGDAETFVYYYQDDTYANPVKVISTLEYLTLVDKVVVTLA